MKSFYILSRTWLAFMLFLGSLTMAEARTAKLYTDNRSGFHETERNQSSLAVAENRPVFEKDYSGIQETYILASIPPGMPVVNAPLNGATGISLDPALEVAVTDPENNSMTVNFYGRKSVAAESPFTMIILPDAQNYTSYLFGGTPSTFTDQTQWCVTSQTSGNIKYVGMVGDITNESMFWEWENANNAMSRLDAVSPGVPFGIVPGNHDLIFGTSTFNSYFGVSRFQGRSYYGGHYGTTNENHYDFFSSGGLDFIVICLGSGDQIPGSSVLDWADALLKNNSSKRGIVINHSLMYAGIQASFTAPGQAIYDALKDNPNLFMMVCGHEFGSGYRQDTYNGNIVYTMIADYQDESNGGNGWLRIVQFDPPKNLIHMTTYSTKLNSWKTSANDQFDIPYNMQSPTFQLIGTVSGVSSGSKASVTWYGLLPTEKYDWYATASDGTSTIASSAWSFTTAAVQLPAAFNVTGGGSYCQGWTGLAVGLSGSETGVIYTLFKDGAAQNPSVAGTGSAISFGNQTAGTYTITGTNGSGNTSMTGSAVVTEIPSGTPAVSVSVTNPDCPGGNGTALFTLTGGTLPYSVRIGSGTYSGSSPITVQLSAGSYSYTATDANNCTQQTGTFSINVPDAISIIGTVTNAMCGQSNGAINITVSGGTLPVTAYRWTGPAPYTSTSQNISALAAGTYSVTVTDSKGCTASKSFAVGSGSSQILISMLTTNNGTVFRTIPTYSSSDPVIWITSKAGNFGLSSQVTLSATPSNGAGGYTYSWSPRTGLSSTKAANVTAKPSSTTTYTLTVKDSKGCTSSTQVKVAVNNINCTTNKKPGIFMCVNGVTQCVPLTNTTVINNTSNLFGSCITPDITGARQKLAVTEPLGGFPGAAIIAYPNPTDGKINLELKDFPEGKARISLFCTDGSLLLDRSVSLIGNDQIITLDISNLSDDLYLIRIVHAGGMNQTMIIKK